MGIVELQRAWEENGAQILAKHAERDAKREAARGTFLQEMELFFSGGKSLEAFRERMDSLTKGKDYWGAKGLSGQMVLNILCIAAEPEELAEGIKRVLPAPQSKTDAKEKLVAFLEVVEEARMRAKSTGVTQPQVGRINSWVSFYWELQDVERWPRFFSTSRDVLEAEGLLRADGLHPDRYLEYLEVLADLKQRLGTSTWGIEHLLWYVGKEMSQHPALTIYESYEAKGLHYPDDLITSLVLSLATKRLVILSGISGTG